MSAICVISSRFESSRFPGKPLAFINGREMVLWVAASCKAAVGLKNTIIATDNQEITKCAVEAGYNVLNVDTRRCNNCSDATAEAVRGLDCDVVVDVQGDEPLITPEDIRKAIEFKRQFHDCVVAAYAYEKDGVNSNTVKVLGHGINGELITMSRQPIPTKARIFKRQVGLYCFYKEQLLRLYGYDKPLSLNEKMEDIHILRCVDNHQKVFLVKLNGVYQSVDVPGDIKKVEDIINGR